MNNELLTTVLCLLSSALCPLHLSRILYKSTHFMQNKANLLDAQMNVSPVITREYKNKSNWKLGENKPNTKPIKANFRKAKMNINKVLTKDYENETLSRRGKNKPNSNPIKPNFKRYLAKMGHHEAVKCVDTPPQFTLNFIESGNSVPNNDKEKESAAERTK